MVAVADYVFETSNAPGTGTFNLAGTVTGRRTWTGTGGAFATGTQVYYGADDGNQWEEGYGTVTSGSPNTLSRDTVIENSLGTTAKINFTTSVKVYCLGPPARRTPLFTADNTALDLGSRKAVNAVAAAAGSDVPRFDQVGEQYVGTYTVSGGTIVVPIPAQDRYRIEVRSIVPSSSSSVYVRLSTDGGSSYRAGSSDYAYALLGDTSTATSRYGGAASSIPFTVAYSGFAAGGEILLDTVNSTFLSNMALYTEIDRCTGTWSFGAPTHLIILCPLSYGYARLSRKPF